MNRICFPALALLTLAACTHTVDPSVKPEKIPTVAPPIQARAVLLLSPSFEEYMSEASAGMDRYRYHYGESASKAMEALVAGSFTSSDVRHVKDLDLLSGAGIDTTAADVVLAPAFARAGARARFFDVKADVVLRLDAKVLHTGETFSWIGEGGTARVITSQKGLTGSALLEALTALRDSIAVHRGELEATGAPSLTAATP